MEKQTKILLGIGSALAIYLIYKLRKKDNFMSINKTFKEFSKIRGEGASKIAKNAKESGGLSMLTFYHFDVKAPYYNKAKEGTLNLTESKEELKFLVEKLNQGINNMSLGQIEFQKLVGEIEVLGELLIEDKS